MKVEQNEIARRKFYQKELTKDIRQWFRFRKESVFNASAQHLPDKYTQVLYKLITGTAESGGSMGCPTHQCIKYQYVTERKIIFFHEKLSK